MWNEAFTKKLGAGLFGGEGFIWQTGSCRPVSFEKCLLAPCRKIEDKEALASSF